MSQHFLLSTRARTLTLASVMRMSDEEAEGVFIRLRWSDNKGEPFCPHCGCPIVYSCRRPNCAPRWRCKACRKDFSVTSGRVERGRGRPGERQQAQESASGDRGIPCEKAAPTAYRNQRRGRADEQHE